MPDTNPIERLLDALPAALSKEKRALIQEKLVEAGMWEHYRQSFQQKPGKDLGEIKARALVVFKRQLGLTDEFFIGTIQFQEKEIRRIARHHYNKVAPETGSVPLFGAEVEPANS